MADMGEAMRANIGLGIPTDLPPHPGFCESVDHAPARRQILTQAEKKLALGNALRYFPTELHEQLASEFALELQTYGRIWMMRYRPTEYEIKAYPISAYPTKSKQAAAIMLMIHNNLDKAVAQFPHECSID